MDSIRKQFKQEQVSISIEIINSLLDNSQSMLSTTKKLWVHVYRIEPIDKNIVGFKESLKSFEHKLCDITIQSKDLDMNSSNKQLCQLTEKGDSLVNEITTIRSKMLYTYYHLLK